MSESEIIDKIGHESFREYSDRTYYAYLEGILEHISISLFSYYIYSYITGKSKEFYYPHNVAVKYFNVLIPWVLVGFLGGFLMCLSVFLVFLILH